MHEAKMHEKTCFLTLTYSDDKLPPNGSLKVEHWQKFAKRLRKKTPFRFFHCGEYSETGRAHYHAAMFGIDFFKDRKPYRTTDQGHQIYTSASLDSTWTHGQCFIGELTFESAAYIARYILKKQFGEAAWKNYGTDIISFEGQAGTWHQKFEFLLKPEYITMSRNPGIAQPWIEKYMDDVYPSDEVIVRGHQAGVPSYYDDQLERRDPALLKRVKAKRKLKALNDQENQTYDRLDIRAEVRDARMRSIQRE